MSLNPTSIHTWLLLAWRLTLYAIWHSLLTDSTTDINDLWFRNMNSRQFDLLSSVQSTCPGGFLKSLNQSHHLILQANESEFSSGTYSWLTAASDEGLTGLTEYFPVFTNSDRRLILTGMELLHVHAVSRANQTAPKAFSQMLTIMRMEQSDTVTRVFQA